ncbi:MAG: hypothetical protein IKZ90_06390 [Clostridiales bacterium]|nr:hypothetical protein [Clostridiales bacterium]
MKSFVKKSLSLLMSTVMAAGIFLVSTPKKEAAVNAACAAKDIMCGTEMTDYLKKVCNTKNAPTVRFASDGMNGGRGRWSLVGYDGSGVARETNAGCITILSKYAVILGQYYYGGDMNGYPGSDLCWIVDLVYTSSSIERQATKTLNFKDDSGEENVEFWALSMQEASGVAVPLRNITRANGNGITGSAWWTRTMVSGKQDAYVIYDGQIATRPIHTGGIGFICACHIDLSKIAFVTTAGEKDKYRGDELKTIDSSTKNEIVLTLYDSDKADFSANLSDTTLALGGTFDIEYSGAYSGSDRGISAVLIDENGKAVNYGSVVSSSSSGTVTMKVPSDLAEGNYTLKVFSESFYSSPNTNCCTNTVDIDVEVKEIVTPPGTVSNPKAEMAGKGKVNLSWDEYEGAEGYHIFAEKGDTFEQIGAVEKGEPTTFADTAALDTTLNKYWIVPYVKDSKGNVVEREIDPQQEEPDVKGKGGCPAVTGIQTVSMTGKVRLTWDASPEAEGYLIYGIRPGVPYGYIGMTTKGTAFSDTKASKTGWNYYWIYPYYVDANGKMIVGGVPSYVYQKAS